MHFTLLATAGIIGTRLHPWKAIQCENEKPPEGLSCQKFKQEYLEEWSFCFSCAGPQIMLQPWPESFIFQDGGRTWHHSCWFCKRAEHKGLGVRDACPMVPEEACESCVQYSGQIP